MSDPGPRRLALACALTVAAWAFASAAPAAAAAPPEDDVEAGDPLDDDDEPAVEDDNASPEPADDNVSGPSLFVPIESPPLPPPRVRHLKPWTLEVGVGLSMVLLDDTGLGEVTADYGYNSTGIGVALQLGAMRDATPWLRLGVRFEARYHSSDNELEPFRIASSSGRGLEMELWRLTPSLVADAHICLEATDCDDEGVEMGVQLVIGGGPTLWTLRDATETAAHFFLEGALYWTFWFEHFGFGLRVGHAGLLQSGLGPAALGHGMVWSPTPGLRWFYRW